MGQCTIGLATLYSNLVKHVWRRYETVHYCPSDHDLRIVRPGERRGYRRASRLARIRGQGAELRATIEDVHNAGNVTRLTVRPDKPGITQPPEAKLVGPATAVVGLAGSETSQSCPSLRQAAPATFLEPENSKTVMS